MRVRLNDRSASELTKAMSYLSTDNATNTIQTMITVFLTSLESRTPPIEEHNNGNNTKQENNLWKLWL